MENSTTKSRAAKIPEETWQSVSHEAIDRGSNIGMLLGIAWKHFMSLPVARRERLVRDLDRSSAA